MAQVRTHTRARIQQETLLQLSLDTQPTLQIGILGFVLHLPTDTRTSVSHPLNPDRLQGDFYPRGCAIGAWETRRGSANLLGCESFIIAFLSWFLRTGSCKHAEYK